jgi:hypothetical protein
MSASLIYDLAPIGAIVAWSDGSPRPPERFKKKLAAWQTRNSSGRLIRKEGPRQSGNHASPGYFTLHEADFGGKNTVVMRIHRAFGLDSDLTFKALEAQHLARSASSIEAVQTRSSSISPLIARRPWPGCKNTAIRKLSSKR